MVQRKPSVPIPDEGTGSSLRMVSKDFTDSKGNTNRCYETRIRVVIDENEYEMQSPVMNGSNPVKDNSMSQQRVWNSMCRSFVKCVAIHTGLGFNLWLKEEMQPFNNIIPRNEEKPSPANIKILKDLCIKHKVNLESLDHEQRKDLGQFISRRCWYNAEQSEIEVW